MKKHLLIGCFLFSTLAFGQKKDYISLSFLSAFPVGDFAKTERNYVSSVVGYAKKGFGGDLSYVHRGNKSNFGFATTLRMRQNKIDTSSLLTNNRLFDPWGSTSITVAWRKKQVKWLLVSLMAGGYCDKALSQKITLNGKVLAGIANVTLPKIDWTATATSPYVGNAAFKRDRDNSTCVSVCITTGLEFSVTKKVTLLLNGEYWYAKPTFKKVKQSYFQAWGGYSQGSNGETDYAIDMSTIDVSLGIALLL